MLHMNPPQVLLNITAMAPTPDEAAANTSPPATTSSTISTPANTSAIGTVPASTSASSTHATSTCTNTTARQPTDSNTDPRIANVSAAEACATPQTPDSPHDECGGNSQGSSPTSTTHSEHWAAKLLLDGLFGRPATNIQAAMLKMPPTARPSNVPVHFLARVQSCFTARKMLALKMKYNLTDQQLKALRSKTVDFYDVFKHGTVSQYPTRNARI
jgi:hypothetical protein